MNRKSEKHFFILSPLIIIAITQVIAIVLGKYLEINVFLLIILIYWVVIVLFLNKYGLGNIQRWLYKPNGLWVWMILAVLLGFSSLPLFVSNIQVFRNASVEIPHILFFLINPWLEEFYWRGLLSDVIKKWPALVSVIYSSFLFTLWHSAFAWY